MNNNRKLTKKHIFIVILFLIICIYFFYSYKISKIRKVQENKIYYLLEMLQATKKKLKYKVKFIKYAIPSNLNIYEISNKDMGKSFKGQVMIKANQNNTIILFEVNFNKRNTFIDDKYEILNLFYPKIEKENLIPANKPDSDSVLTDYHDVFIEKISDFQSINTIILENKKNKFQLRFENFIKNKKRKVKMNFNKQEARKTYFDYFKDKFPDAKIDEMDDSIMGEFVDKNKPVLYRSYDLNKSVVKLDLKKEIEFPQLTWGFSGVLYNKQMDKILLIYSVYISAETGEIYSIITNKPELLNDKP